MGVKADAKINGFVYYCIRDVDFQKVINNFYFDASVKLLSLNRFFISSICVPHVFEMLFVLQHL